MKTYKIILFICLAQVFLLGCHKKPPSIEDDSLRFKIHNLSNYTLKNIGIASHSIIIKENLIPGESSSIYKLTPFEPDREEDSKVSAFIIFKAEDKVFGSYITLQIKLLIMCMLTV